MTNAESLAEEVKSKATESLARAVKSSGFTGAQLARKIGVSPGYVSQLLSGVCNPTLLAMSKVAIALDMDVRLLLVEKERL